MSAISAISAINALNTTNTTNTSSTTSALNTSTTSTTSAVSLPLSASQPAADPGSPPGGPPAVTPQAVLDFWFGQPAAAQPRAEWFRKDPAFDRSIAQQFGTAIDAALATGLPAWGAGPEAALARIVVLDQFMRNVFRDTPRAFAGDARALAAARALVASGDHLQLAPLQRWFVYLPFEHAESAAAQDESMRLFGELAAQHPALADAQQWAHKHQLIIQRFDRYPHRNAVLGRLSTDEEQAFLREPASSF